MRGATHLAQDEVVPPSSRKQVRRVPKRDQHKQDRHERNLQRISLARIPPPHATGANSPTSTPELHLPPL